MSDLKHEVIEERWAAFIKECMDSGMTIKEWCREKNINESRYYYWFKTLHEKEADGMRQEMRASPFVELPATRPRQKLPEKRAATVIRKSVVVKFFCNTYG